MIEFLNYICFVFKEKKLFFFFLVSQFVVHPHTGSIGCNFCGVRRIFNHRFQNNVAWVLCKECQFVHDKGYKQTKRFTQVLPIPGHRWTKRPIIDLTGPKGKLIDAEQYYWDAPGEKLPQFRNEYHLLEYHAPLKFNYLDVDSSDSEYSSSSV